MLLCMLVTIESNQYHLFTREKSLLRDNVDLLGSLADLYFRAGDNKNSVLKFEQAQMLDPYLIKGMDVYGYLLAREGRLEDVENLGCRLLIYLTNMQNRGWSLGVIASIANAILEPSI